MGFGVVDPIPTVASGALDVVPFANHPPVANLEPSAGLVDAGFAPAPDAPDYRNVNFMLHAQSQLNSRGIQNALFVEEATATVTIAGAMGVGNDRRITINAHNIDDTGANLDTATIVAARFVAAINSNVLVNTKVFASSSAGVVTLEGIVPGLVFTLAVAANIGAGWVPIPGMIVVTSAPVQPIIRVDWSGTGNPDDPGQMDLVIGSLKADDYGGVIGDKRIIWRKAKGAFRAGEFTGALGDNATTGANSIGLGLDAQAAGARAVAIGGTGSNARAADALAMMGGDAHGTEDIAIGVGADANRGAGLEALAIGSLAHAGVAGVAIGVQNDALGGGATAVGNANTASGADSVSLGSGTTASADAAIAIGDGVVTSGKGGFGSGITTAGNEVLASGLGSRAHGAPHLSNGVDGSDVVASGEGANAHGDDVRASGKFSNASGGGAIAANQGERAHSSLPNATSASNYQGQHQHGDLILQANTSDDTTLIKFCTDSVTGGGTEWIPTDNRGLIVHYRCVATIPTTADTAVWEGSFMANKLTGALVLTAGFKMTGAANAIGANAPDIATGAFVAGASRLTISASTTKIRFEANGEAAKDVRWALSIQYAQSGNVI